MAPVRRIKRPPKTVVVDEVAPFGEEEFEKVQQTLAPGWLPQSAYPKPKKILEFDGGLFDGATRRRVSLGIDTAAGKPGLAAFCPDDETYFAWVLHTNGTGVQRLMQIRDFFNTKLLHLVLRSSEIEHTCMEGYGFASQMAHTLGEAGGQAKIVLAERLGWQKPAAYPTLVVPARVKKFATGSGSHEVKKQQMLLAVYKKYGIEFTDDNACDAYVLARIASILLADEATHAGLLAYEREVVSALKQEAFSEWPEGFLKPTPRRAPSEAKTEKSSSGSAVARTSSRSRRRSPTPSSTTTTSSSAPSGRRRSIKRSRPSS